MSEPPDYDDSRGDLYARLNAKENQGTGAVFSPEAYGYATLSTIVQNACYADSYGELLEAMIRNHCGRFGC